MLNFKQALAEYIDSALSDDKNEIFQKLKNRYKSEWDRFAPEKIDVFFDLTAATLENNDKQVDIINLCLDNLTAQDIEKYFKLFDDEYRTFSQDNSKEFFIHATYTINVLMDNKLADLSFLQEASRVLPLHIAAEQFLFSFLDGEPTDSIKEIKGIFNILLENQSHGIKRYTEIASATSQHIILI